MPAKVFHDEGALLRSLLVVGVNLSVTKDRQTMLDMILGEARSLARAEAGTLYVVDGDILKFVAVQNDKLTAEQIASLLIDREIPLTGDSLAGFAASSGKIINIPDTYDLPDGSPFRIHREFDAATGYKVHSILAIPLICPDGRCVGVLQLINHVESDGTVSAFPNDERGGIASMASMAAVTIQNSLLQDQLKKAQLDCIMRLSTAAEFRDDDTADHIRRITSVSTLIAKAMGLSCEETELIQHASPMHDIGKIGIPDSILHKPGPLTFEERNIVEKHTLIGADILADPPNELISIAREVALTHHERWDGKGYPNALSGKEIPLCGRIVAMADVFDALVSKRCYKEAFALEIALEIVRFEDGKHFDPDVAKAFFDTLQDILDCYGQMVER